MNNFFRAGISGLNLILLLSCLSESAYADQIVTITPSNAFIAPGESVTIIANYAISAPTTHTEAGLGLRLHFNSQVLAPVSQNLLATGKQPIGDPSDDSDNLDNDPLTDKFIVLGWLDNDAQWPGSASFPLELFRADFSANTTLNNSSYIRLSASSTAKNTPFQSTPVMLCAKPTLSVTTPSQTISEEATSNPVFSISADKAIPAGCGAIEIAYQLTGSAESNTDYQLASGTLLLAENSTQVDLPVTLIDDTAVEEDETVTFTLTGSQHYQLGSSTQATLTLVDNDTAPIRPEVNLSISKSTVTEGSSGSILLYASRSNGDLSTALTVQLSFSGTLNIGSDTLAFPSSITIPAGQQQAFAVLVITDDADDETDEQLNISIVSNPAYQIGASGTLLLLIQDDEYTQHTSLPLPKTDTGTVTADQVSIPTMTEWMLMLLSALLAMTAGLHFCRDQLAGGKS